MGTGNHDMEAQHRRLEARYALDNAKGVRLLLEQLHALYERQYCGDYAAVDVLIDMQTAIERAGLTDRQKQALQLVYEEDLTQEESGKRLCISQQRLGRHLLIAETKIARVYEYWARHSEGYSLSIEMEAV